MTNDEENILNLSGQQHKVIIKPADCCASTIDTHVQLINLSAGGALRKSLGAAYLPVVRQLYQSPDTLQSSTCTWTASVDEEIVGQVSAIPPGEFSARRSASAKIIWQGSRVAAIHVYSDLLRRWLSRTALGPWASDQLYLQSLAVASVVRCKGIGASLLDHMEAVALERSSRALCLATLTSNTGAVSLFESRGFDVVAQKGHRIKMLKVVGTDV